MESRTIYNSPDDFVFCNAHGKPWSPETMRAVIGDALDAIGFERVSRATGAHVFRHTAASFLLAATGDLKLTAQQLGHSSIQTTANIYVHTDDARRLRSAEILSEPFAQILPTTAVN